MPQKKKKGRRNTKTNYLRDRSVPDTKEKSQAWHSFHGPRTKARGVAEPSQGQGRVTETVAYFKCCTFNKSMSLTGGKKSQCTIIVPAIG